MPGYGIKPADEGTGLLPWSWAEQQLREAQNYWVATNGPDGQPHLSPVWGYWDGEQLLFSCAIGSRKARDLAADSHCTISTESALNQVVLQGMAELVTEWSVRMTALHGMNQKYNAEMPEEFFAVDKNAVFALRPVWAFGLMHDDFDGSPTRWTFGD